MPRFEFDSELCIGCYACETACKVWHRRCATEGGFRAVERVEEGSFPEPHIFYTSRALPGCDLCRSCGGEPRCAVTCPTGALRWE